MGDSVSEGVVVVINGVEICRPGGIVLAREGGEREREIG